MARGAGQEGDVMGHEEISPPGRSGEWPEVVLRDPRPDDLEFLEFLDSAEVGGEWDSFDDPVEELLSAKDFGGDKQIVTLADTTRVGCVSWIRVPYGPNARSLAWSIGITIHPNYRGRGLATSAQRQLAERLLRRSPSNRVQADTDPDNVAEQRALMSAGFTREGIARGAQWRRGEWRDRVVFSLVRSDLTR
ncbi:MAG: GNAT family N-acetyltransferase [Acidobacteriota bacterium]|nr:GNAT family N-acetyltransferase [Acidobacteriota bacterium]